MNQEMKPLRISEVEKDCTQVDYEGMAQSSGQCQCWLRFVSGNDNYLETEGHLLHLENQFKVQMLLLSFYFIP